MKKYQNDSTTVGMLGNAFLTFPRSMFGWLFSEMKQQRSAGLLYSALLSKVYFKAGYVKVQNRLYPCDADECIMTRKELSAYCGLKRGALDNALDCLIQAGLVDTVHLPGATRFILCGYGELCKKTKGANPTNPDDTAEWSAASSLAEAERQIGGRSMQFDNLLGHVSGKEQA